MRIPAHPANYAHWMQEALAVNGDVNRVRRCAHQNPRSYPLNSMLETLVRPCMAVSILFSGNTDLPHLNSEGA
eukprot:522447-Pyramimonas_sp.AAC.2